MAGMIADIGERARVIRKRRIPGKPVMVAATATILFISALILGNIGSEAGDVPPERGWQAISVWLPQTCLEIAQSGNKTVASYHFTWNSSYDFSALNWSAIDTSRTEQKFVLGLGAKIWVARANVTADFPIEITQGDGTSLGYTFEYKLDRESPHIYLTGERTYWKWDRTPSIVHDYRATGSCSIEDAWRDGSWSPEEGISLTFDPEGSVDLGRCDFAIRLFVYDIMLPELRTLVPIVALVGIAIIVFERRRIAS